MKSRARAAVGPIGWVDFCSQPCYVSFGEKGDRAGMRCPQCHSDNPETTRFCRECGTLLRSPDDIIPSRTETLHPQDQELASGALFAARYQIIEELGRGGMGRVYRALDRKISCSMPPSIHNEDLWKH